MLIDRYLFSVWFASKSYTVVGRWTVGKYTGREILPADAIQDYIIKLHLLIQSLRNVIRTEF